MRTNTTTLLSGLLLLVCLAGATGCSRTVTGNAGDGLFERSASDPRREGGIASPGARATVPEARSLPPGPPSLSQVDRPDPLSLGRSDGEVRIAGDEIVTSPPASSGGYGDMGIPRSRRAVGDGVPGGGATDLIGDLGEVEGLHDVFFAYDSALISKDGQQALLKNLAWLRSHTDKGLVIEGHCDDRGSFAYNLVLGERRARAIAKFLGEQRVETNRLAVVSYGKERPFCRDLDERCFQLNRRAHMIVRR
ncbi:OmpA family protein [Candidatus Nitrospira bockiana]